MPGITDRARDVVRRRFAIWMTSSGLVVMLAIAGLSLFWHTPQPEASGGDVAQQADPDATQLDLPPEAVNATAEPDPVVDPVPGDPPAGEPNLPPIDA